MPSLSLNCGRYTTNNSQEKIEGVINDDASIVKPESFSNAEWQMRREYATN
jgi:hypothetical protein